MYGGREGFISSNNPFIFLENLRYLRKIHPNVHPNQSRFWISGPANRTIALPERAEQRPDTQLRDLARKRGGDKWRFPFNSREETPIFRCYGSVSRRSQASAGRGRIPVSGNGGGGKPPWRHCSTLPCQTARSHTEHLLSSAAPWAMEMWKANSASHIPTAPTTAARYTRPQT
jgi:hypothetical protein